MFVDEPGSMHFDVLGKAVAEYKRLFPEKLPYINLLPMYANAKQLAGGAWMADIEYYETEDVTFQKHLDEYVEKVPTDYINVDIYPCFVKDGVKTVYEDYVRSIEIVADTCRKSGREFWCYIQASSWNPTIRVPDEADYRWQVYTMLSYGVTNLLDFIFCDLPTFSEGSPVAKDGTKSPMWFYKRRTAAEVRAISDIFVQYKNLGAFSVNCTEATPYLRMANPYKGFDVLSDIQCDKPLLVGCFEKKNGKGSAFTLVNMNDLAKPDYAEVKVKIAGKVTSCYGGHARVETADEDGCYLFTLGAGDGVFVTVD